MVLLVVAALCHALLGVALAVLTWLVGAVPAARLPGRRLENGYAAGLILVTAAAFAVLLAWPVAVVAAPVLAYAAWRGLAAVPADAAVRARRAVVGVLPGAVAFGVALGLFQHGPDDERGSNAFGDLVFYVAELTSAAQSVLPFRDLSVAGLEHTYVQSAPAFVGGALEWLPGFDPFLFFAATLPAFLWVALALGAAADGPAQGSVVAAAALAVGASAYPTWLSESPPVTLAAPVVFSFAAFLAVPGVATVVLAAAALVLTKGIAILPLLALASPRDVRTRRSAILAGAAVAAAAVVGVLAAGWLTELLTLDFLPADAVDGLRSQLDARDTQQLAPALLVAGHVLLVAGTARLGNTPMLAAVVAGVAASWLIGGHATDVAVLLPALLVALELRRAPVERVAGLLLRGAAFVLVGAAFVRDVAGLGTAATLLALAIVALVGGLGDPAPARALRLAAASALVVAIAAVAGFLRLDPAAPPLTSDDANIAEQVRDLVPEDALVFTSRTGPAITTDGGWNYASALSGRRHYVAGWANSRLRVDDDARARRLALNRRALDGETAEAVADAGVDGSTRLFAVLRRSEPAPRGARRLYANGSYALYELQAP